jgi:hypothetical protein
MRAGSQLLHGAEPVLFRGTNRAASRLPELMGKGRDLGMAERGDAMANRRPVGMPMSFLGMLHGLARMLVPRQGTLLPLFRHKMRMFGALVHFRGPLVVLVIRSSVITSGHNWEI